MHNEFSHIFVTPIYTLFQVLRIMNVFLFYITELVFIRR